jgi:hypothetical protein
MTDNRSSYTREQADVVGEDRPYVHPQETTVPLQPSNNFRDFMISGQRAAVEYYQELYTQVDIRDHKNRTFAYTQCRSVAWFVRHVVTKEVRVASTRCNLRWCPLCLKTKRYIMKQTIIPWVKKQAKPKFITLTLKHSTDSLTDQLDRIYDSFRKLRKKPIWKKPISGGLWFFQVKKSATDGQWHPHIHIIVGGKYLPWDDLKKTWLEITGDSEIIDIRAVKDAKKTADYVARYATAPADLTQLPMDESIEVFDALAGRRMCGTFGDGKEIQLCPKKCPDADQWEEIGNFWQVMNSRFDSDQSLAILACWTAKKPLLIDISPPQPPPDAADTHKEFEPQTYKQMCFDWSTFYEKGQTHDDIPI